MNNRWLIALLIASWTFNVMLGVAYYLRSHYPTGGYWMSETFRPHHARPQNDTLTAARKAFEQKIDPIIDRRRQMFINLADLFSADEIDSLKLERFSDSLDIINSEFQRSQLIHLREMHARMAPDRRHKMARRLIRRFEGRHERHGPPHRRGRIRGKSE